MDAEIGRVIQWLKDNDEYDNTFIFFSSDNGAEGTFFEALPVLGEDFQASIRKYFDNSLDNIGRPNSFTSIGPAWAQAATAPNRMYKVSLAPDPLRVRLLSPSCPTGLDHGRRDPMPGDRPLSKIPEQHNLPRAHDRHGYHADSGTPLLRSHLAFSLAIRD